MDSLILDIDFFIYIVIFLNIVFCYFDVNLLNLDFYVLGIKVYCGFW